MDEINITQSIWAICYTKAKITIFKTLSNFPLDDSYGSVNYQLFEKSKRCSFMIHTNVCGNLAISY